MLHESLVVSVLLYVSETIWREKEKSRIRAVLLDYHRGLLGIRRMGKILNARVREVCKLT